MAGKHKGADIRPGFNTPPLDENDSATIHHYHPKLDKAYAEGRAGVPAINTHPPGSQAFIAYQEGATFQGDPDRQFETGIV